jgi:hypothetical protein
LRTNLNQNPYKLLDYKLTRRKVDDPKNNARNNLKCGDRTGKVLMAMKSTN